mgnify:CR=1 FL=1
MTSCVHVPREPQDLCVTPMWTTVTLERVIIRAHVWTRWTASDVTVFRVTSDLDVKVCCVIMFISKMVCFTMQKSKTNQEKQQPGFYAIYYGHIVFYGHFRIAYCILLQHFLKFSVCHKRYIHVIWVYLYPASYTVIVLLSGRPPLFLVLIRRYMYNLFAVFMLTLFFLSPYRWCKRVSKFTV